MTAMFVTHRDTALASRDFVCYLNGLGRYENVMFGLFGWGRVELIVEATL